MQGNAQPLRRLVELEKPHLIVPYSLTNNDGKYANTMSTSDQWFNLVKDAFDVLYKEGAQHPKMMSVGMHMRILGHPARTAGLWRLLDYLQQQKGVWITRRLDIANTHLPGRTRNHDDRICPGAFLKENVGGTRGKFFILRNACRNALARIHRKGCIAKRILAKPRDERHFRPGPRRRPGLDRAGQQLG